MDNAAYIRDDEVDQAVLEQHAHELRSLAVWEGELDGAEDEHDEVEAHRVDERRSEDCVVRLGDGAAHIGDPFSFQQDTYTLILAAISFGVNVDVPCKMRDQCPKMTRTSGITMYKLWDHRAMLCINAKLITVYDSRWLENLRPDGKLNAGETDGRITDKLMQESGRVCMRI